MPPSRRSLLRALRAGGVVAVLATAGCAAATAGTPVPGQPPAALVPVDSESLSLRVEFESTLEEVNEYWTPERQKDAVPRDPVLPEDIGLAGADSPTGVVVDPTAGPPTTDRASVPSSSAGDRADGVTSSPHGRLYMSFEGGDSVCSATVVTAQGRDMVVTAAHCVWDTYEGRMASNVMFIPEDSGNGADRPHGTWVATRVAVPGEFAERASSTADGYIVGDGWAYDFAFLVMAPAEDGTLIQDVTGGQGIAFGIPVSDLVVLGYPSAAPFDGGSQRFCASDTWSARVYAYSIDCIMTPGASGGGWLTSFDPGSRSGYVVATSSFSDGSSLGAAPLGATALDLYTELGGLG